MFFEKIVLYCVVLDWNKTATPDYIYRRINNEGMTNNFLGMKQSYQYMKAIFF